MAYKRNPEINQVIHDILLTNFPSVLKHNKCGHYDWLYTKSISITKYKQKQSRFSSGLPVS